MASVPGDLAVILGASTWPHYPSFEPSVAFRNSANFFRSYLLQQGGLGLPPENLLWLFDDDSQPGIILAKVGEFLRANVSEATRHILFFFVGHGGYIDKGYFLALRCTSQKSRDLTVLPVKYIAQTLYEETPDKRHIVVIDACYASGAVKDFIYQDSESAIADVQRQVRESLPEDDISRGSALLCAAGPKAKAKAPWEGEYTMFSGALRHVLMTGDPALEERLSLEEVADLVVKEIFNAFRAEGVRPELHTPKQEKGDIRKLRLFPNPARLRRVASPAGDNVAGPTPPEYFCYISKSKIDEFLEVGGPEEPASQIGMPSPEVDDLIGADVPYGRRDIIQPKTLGREYATRLREVLSRLKPYILPFDWKDARLDAGALRWARMRFTCGLTGATGQMVRLTAIDGGRRLELYCSLANFSGRLVKDGKWIENSTSYAFFSEAANMTFETVFMVTDQSDEKIIASPLFLKIPITKGLHL